MMRYNAFDDLFESRDGSVEIRPTGLCFNSTYEIELAVGDDYIIIDVNQISEVIEGLNKVMDKTGGGK